MSPNVFKMSTARTSEGAADQHRVPEVAERVDPDQERGAGKAGPGQRQRDRPEGVEPAGAQVAGRVLERRVDPPEHAGQREIRDREKGQGLNDPDAVPAVDVAAEAKEPVRHQAAAAEEEDEGQTADERRRDERQERDDAEQRAAGDVGPRRGVGEQEPDGDGRERGQERDQPGVGGEAEIARVGQDTDPFGRSGLPEDSGHWHDHEQPEAGDDDEEGGRAAGVEGEPPRPPEQRRARGRPYFLKSSPHCSRIRARFCAAHSSL
jgi:hypothetical protein